MNLSTILTVIKKDNPVTSANLPTTFVNLEDLNEEILISLNKSYSNDMP